MAEAPARLRLLAAVREDVDPQFRCEAQPRRDAEAARARRGALDHWCLLYWRILDMVRHDKKPRHGQRGEGRPDERPAAAALHDCPRRRPLVGCPPRIFGSIWGRRVAWVLDYLSRAI